MQIQFALVTDTPGDHAKDSIREFTRVSTHHSTRGLESEEAGNPPSHPAS